MSTYLLWCDLETTGLDLRHDEIIEAAFILTDTDLAEIKRWHQVIQPSTLAWERLLENKLVREMHLANGLIDDVVRIWFKAYDEARVARLALDRLSKRMWVDLHQAKVGETPILTDEDVVHLAGSGIAAFDRPLIRRDMDAIEGILHYAPIDVGVLKRTWQMWAGGPITQDEAVKNHRALSDVEGHLAEARAFREAFKTFAEQS